MDKLEENRIKKIEMLNECKIAANVFNKESQKAHYYITNEQNRLNFKRYKLNKKINSGFLKLGICTVLLLVGIVKNFGPVYTFCVGAFGGLGFIGALKNCKEDKDIRISEKKLIEDIDIVQNNDEEVERLKEFIKELDKEAYGEWEK